MHALRTCALAHAGVALSVLALPSTAAPSGGDLDLSVELFHVTQSVQTLNQTVTLVGERSTVGRLVTKIEGEVPAGAQLDALVRVFVDGAEADFSPLYSDNGPIEPPAAASPANEDDTLQFSFRVPVSDNVVFEIELNPPGPNQILESDYTNNTFTTAPFDFQCRRIPYLVYVPIDYRPGGGATPNLPDPALIEPGVGDNFNQGIFPSPDWEYFLTPAGSKLWTSSLSGSGSSLLSSLLGDLNQMNPQPDFIYGWVPGSLPYNGQAIGIPGKAGMGNTQSIRHQRTFAHELGHLFGLSHISQNIVSVGIDVEHHLAITQGLPYVKSAGLNDIMVPGLLTNQAWTWINNQNFFLNHGVFQCQAPLSDAGAGELPALMVGGLWNHGANTLELTHAVTLENARPSASVPVEQADLLLRAWTPDALVLEQGLTANTPTDSCSAHCAEDDCENHEHGDSEGALDPIAAFVHVLPTAVDPRSIERVSVVDPVTGRELVDLVRTPNAPVVAITAPQAGTTLGDQVVIQWEASDADGDELRFYLRYSPDGESVVPLASEILEREYVVELSQLPALTSGAGYFEVLATDGLNTSIARVGRQDAGLSQDGGGAAPTTYILTPDDGKTYQKGATVLLHSSGWDLEDFELVGSEVVWSSDLDGQLGIGRYPTVNDLSVGTHVISVTVTDTDGMTATDSATITVTDRVLPGENCQTDLGFGGPGSSSLEVCGGDLSSGTTGEVRLSGATPGAGAFLFVGFSNAPTPALGGTLVPVPADLVIPGMVDAGGNWIAASFPGGNGPATVYVQAVYEDPAQFFGYGVSNAVQVEYLP